MNSYPFQIRSIEQYEQAYRMSMEQPEAFWASVAEHFLWRRKWDRVLEWNFKEPDIKWFEGAKLNITENCLDRYLEKSGDTPAIIWEPNDPKEKSRTLTYRDMYQQVCLFANVLKNIGVKHEQGSQIHERLKHARMPHAVAILRLLIVLIKSFVSHVCLIMDFEFAQCQLRHCAGNRGRCGRGIQSHTPAFLFLPAK